MWGTEKGSAICNILSQTILIIFRERPKIRIDTRKYYLLPFFVRSKLKSPFSDLDSGILSDCEVKFSPLNYIFCAWLSEC